MKHRCTSHGSLWGTISLPPIILPGYFWGTNCFPQRSISPTLIFSKITIRRIIRNNFSRLRTIKRLIYIYIYTYIYQHRYYIPFRGSCLPLAISSFSSNCTSMYLSVVNLIQQKITIKRISPCKYHIVVASAPNVNSSDKDKNENLGHYWVTKF